MKIRMRRVPGEGSERASGHVLVSAWVLVLGVVPMLLLGGCGAAAGDDDARPHVVATTTMIGDLVRQIAGERVRLTVIMGPGIDPHTYTPSTADMGRLQRGRIIFYNGLQLEGALADVLERRLAHRAVAVTRDIPRERLLPWADEGYGAFDPHVWFDVELWMYAAGTVRDVLIEVDPQNADEYRQRTEQHLAELRELDEYVRQRIGSLPEHRRVLITSHDAFGYFGRAYGVEVRALQGISTEGEASLSAINAAVRFVLEHQVPAIFVESSVNPRTIERVQADVRGRGFDVQIGGELYSDAMGHPGEHPGYAVETYVGMVRYNVDTIVKALR